MDIDNTITANLTAALDGHRWTIHQLVTVAVALDIPVATLLNDTAPPAS